MQDWANTGLWVIRFYQVKVINIIRLSPCVQAAVALILTAKA